jgi:6-pyruvoyltetrahydropterin/6-carboxytetrahydropterin synthase
MARAVFEELKRRLAEAALNPATRPVLSRAVRIERVRVTETSSSWAEYSP